MEELSIIHVSGMDLNQSANDCQDSKFVSHRSAGICSNTKTQNITGKTHRAVRLRRSNQIRAKSTRSVNPKVIH